MTRDLADIAADLSEVEIKVKWAARTIGESYAKGEVPARYSAIYWDLRQAHTLLGKLIEELREAHWNLGQAYTLLVKPDE